MGSFSIWDGEEKNLKEISRVYGVGFDGKGRSAL